MRRLSISLLVMATVLFMAVPATAKKGGTPGPPDPEPEVANTCNSPWWDGAFESSRSISSEGIVGVFEVTLDKDNPNACVDVLTEFEGEWGVTVDLVRGSGPRALTIVPRDGVAPGDSCGGIGRRGDVIYDEWVLPHPDDQRFDGTIPASTVNACRGDAPVGEPGEFDETLEWASGVDKLDFVSVLGTAGPVAETQNYVMDATGEIHPFVLLIFSQGLRKSDEILITVTLPTGP